MDYNRLYQRFIESRPTRKKEFNKGLETHHILPRSLGGLDTADNRIVLTCKEHWLAHRMLYKMHIGTAKGKMAYALQMMSGTGRYNLTARQYEQIRKINSNATTRQWRDPEYVAKQRAYRSSEERRAISRQTMLVNRSKMRQWPKRGKTSLEVLKQRHIEKYGKTTWYLRKRIKQEQS